MYLRNYFNFIETIFKFYGSGTDFRSKPRSELGTEQFFKILMELGIGLRNFFLFFLFFFQNYENTV